MRFAVSVFFVLQNRRYLGIPSQRAVALLCGYPHRPHGKSCGHAADRDAYHHPDMVHWTTQILMAGCHERPQPTCAAPWRLSRPALTHLCAFRVAVERPLRSDALWSCSLCYDAAERRTSRLPRACSKTRVRSHTLFGVSCWDNFFPRVFHGFPRFVIFLFLRTFGVFSTMIGLKVAIQGCGCFPFSLWLPCWAYFG